ncbi:3D domain-containing protein [Myxococcota bacterium]|nr:3D domain-containing protein [Myxococcota bacterium]
MPRQSLQARLAMTQDPGRPNERRTFLRKRALDGLLAAISAIALLVLSGCAALPMQRDPAQGASAESVDRPESAAEPSEPPSADESPPDSSDVPTPATPTPRVLLVKASAYNSHRGQTDSTPSIGAWGDRLKPGMKVIAVSKDLLELGLRRGQRVTIVGLPGEYVVLDRMPSRWRQKIDIYMGRDVRAALRWGVRQVEISWIPEDETGIDPEAADEGDSAGRPGASVDTEAD